MAYISINDKIYNFEKYISIGRSSKAKIKIDDRKLSRIHCEIIKDDNDYILIDLHSQNGIKVNNKNVTEIILKDKDEIIIGRIKAQFFI